MYMCVYLPLPQSHSFAFLFVYLIIVNGITIQFYSTYRTSLSFDRFFCIYIYI